MTEPLCRADREGGRGIISQKEARVGWRLVPISLPPQGHLPILCQKKALHVGTGAGGPSLTHLSCPDLFVPPPLLQAGLTLQYATP